LLGEEAAKRRKGKTMKHLNLNKSGKREQKKRHFVLERKRSSQPGRKGGSRRGKSTCSILSREGGHLEKRIAMQACRLSLNTEKSIKRGITSLGKKPPAPV